MAKQQGLFKFTGKLGNLVGYKLNGKYIARTIGAVDRHKMQTAPQYAVTRQNQSLFATASRAGKAFRHALLPFTKGVTDSSFASRVVSIMLQSLKSACPQPNQQPSLSNGFQQSNIKQAFRNLSIYNHHTQKHIPTTLIQPTSTPNQFILNPQSLWRKASDKAAKKVEIGYIHLDIDSSVSQYEPALCLSFSQGQLPTHQSLHLPKAKIASYPCSFLLVQVYSMASNNGTPEIRNIYIQDIIDNVLSKPELLDKGNVARPKHSKIIQLQYPSSYPLISLALCSYYGSKANEHLLESSPLFSYNSS